MDNSPSSLENYLRNQKFSLKFTNPKGDESESVVMSPHAFYLHLRQIQRKLPDTTTMCPMFSVKKGQSRMDAWQIFQDGLRAYLRTIGTELVEILDHGKFAPPYPTLLSTGLQEWLSPDDFETYINNDVANEVDEDGEEIVKVPVKSKIKKFKGQLGNTPTKRRKLKVTISPEGEGENEEDPTSADIERISQRSENEESTSAEVKMVANFESPIFQALVKTSHNRLAIEANQIYIALTFFMDMLIRKHTEKDEEAKQAHGAAPIGHLFKLLACVGECMVSLSTIFSDKRLLAFNTKNIEDYDKKLNLRKYFLEFMKEAEILKSHFPNHDLLKKDNLFRIIHTAISKHNVARARELKRVYISFHKDFQSTWVDFCASVADEAAEVFGDDQPLLTSTRKQISNGLGNKMEKGSDSNGSKENSNKKKKREKEGGINPTEGSPKKKKKCDYCGGTHSTDLCWEKPENEHLRPDNFSPKKSESNSKSHNTSNSSNKSKRSSDVKSKSDKKGPPKDDKKSKGDEKKYSGKHTEIRSSSESTNSSDESE